MKRTLLVIWILCLPLFARPEASQRLSDVEVKTLFTPSFMKQHKIAFDVYRSYRYKDTLGEHYIVLTEHSYVNQDDETNYDKIRAYSFLVTKGTWTLEWQMKDFMNTKVEEYSIWFWSRYIRLDDLDGDGVVDPILVYGTSGMNFFEDGRMKILIYKNNKKVAIRHQNSISDFRRHTQVDVDFYKLSSSIQDYVKTLIQKMSDNNHILFSSQWQKSMRNHEILFPKR